MNKLLVVTVLVALFALSAESFRVSRQVEEEQGTVTRITDKVRTFYDSTVNTASEYLENVKGMKLEEKARSLLADPATIFTTYSNILQDQMYHLFYAQQ
uniref:Apolipoprotein C-II n=1 Tax=Rachycentron canadum TaxID=141264 RepID=D3GF37_RACCA|nr:apolipoprotein C-II [Rachycentron canadum]